MEFLIILLLIILNGGRMQKAIDHLEEELLNVRAGKASPNALNGVMVDYFGSHVWRN